MNPPIELIPNFIVDHKVAFDRLWTELNWVRIENVPRSEYYCVDSGKPYTYGRGAGMREYAAQPWHTTILDIRKRLEDYTDRTFEVCFLNGYKDGHDSLGWHADDSPEMDDSRPIGIVSLGARREIYFASQTNKAEVTKVWLESGSLCLMKPGMQDTHFHRIPRASYHGCGPRISLTFRGWVE